MVAIRPLQLWHVLEVHAVETSQDLQRQDDEHDHGQGVQDVIHLILRLPVVLVGQVLAERDQRLRTHEELLEVVRHVELVVPADARRQQVLLGCRLNDGRQLAQDVFDQRLDDQQQPFQLQLCNGDLVDEVSLVGLLGR